MTQDFCQNYDRTSLRFRIEPQEQDHEKKYHIKLEAAFPRLIRILYCNRRNCTGLDYRLGTGGRAERLHHEPRLQHCLGDRDRDQHDDRHDPGRQPARRRGGQPRTAARSMSRNANSNDVSVIATATNTVTATIPVGTYPLGVAVTPRRQQGLCHEQRLQHCLGDRYGDQHGERDDPGRQRPLGVAVTPDGSKVYVANFTSPTTCR